MSESAATQAAVAPEMIITAFELLGGDPSNAIESASNFDSVGTWSCWQALQAGTVGSVAAAIPVAHVALILPDILFLMHKMAYCSWGVGAIQKCPIEAKEDLSVILAMYVGIVTKDALIASAGTGSLIMLGGQIANIGLPAFLGQLTSHGISTGLSGLGLSAGVKTAAKIAAKSVAVTAPLIAHVSGKLAEKIAAKFVAKAAIKALAKGGTSLLAGLVPFLGPVVGGGINAYFVGRIALSAKEYYEIKGASLRHNTSRT